MMRLRLGQSVNATDGRFGKLGDIVVDPYRRTVTHLVVEPDVRHFQARLVPTWLIEEAGGELTVQLDTAHLRRLERSSYSDFVPIGEPIDIGEEWDIGTEDLVSVPYVNTDFDIGWTDERVAIEYHKVPKGDVEIRRTSDVVTSDDHAVGKVEGMVADDDYIGAILVRAGMPGFKHDTLVPLGSVGAVRNDRITLTITRKQFHLLPRVSDTSASTVES